MSKIADVLVPKDSAASASSVCSSIMVQFDIIPAMGEFKSFDLKTKYKKQSTKYKISPKFSSNVPSENDLLNLSFENKSNGSLEDNSHGAQLSPEMVEDTVSYYSSKANTFGDASIEQHILSECLLLRLVRSQL